MVLRLMTLSFLTVFLVPFFQVQAEDQWNVSVHTGPLLPARIKGVTEIQPSWGVSLGYGQKAGGFELGWLQSRDKGVDY